MSWDPVLLRKYNATGHFRLLSQLRSEIVSHPIQRPQADGSPARRGRGSSSSSRRSTARVGASEAANTSSDYGTASANSAPSFRERLNAIEMR